MRNGPVSTRTRPRGSSGRERRAGGSSPSARRRHEPSRRQREHGTIEPFEGETALYIKPGHTFRAVDALVTNFHLPRTSLLVLVAALAGYDLVRAAYEEAIRERYRFYSYGDAMLVLS